MYKYHSVGISHTFFYSLTPTYIKKCMFKHTLRHSERQIYEALVTVAALPVVGLQMRAKARGWGGLNFPAQTMNVKEALQRHSVRTRRCCLEHKRRGRPVKIETCISIGTSCHSCVLLKNVLFNSCTVEKELRCWGKNKSNVFQLFACRFMQECPVLEFIVNYLRQDHKQQENKSLWQLNILIHI